MLEEEGCVQEEEGCVLEEEGGVLEEEEHEEDEEYVQEEEGCVLEEEVCMQEEEGCVFEEEERVFGEEEHMQEERECVQGCGTVRDEDVVEDDLEGEEESTGDSAGTDVSRASSGPTRDLCDKAPAEVYEELLTPAIVDNILVESNRYANQYVDSHNDYLDIHPRARAHGFIRAPFSVVEIYK